MVTNISVVRDYAMYKNCVSDNSNCAGMRLVALDNSESNLPVSVRYNQFLDKYDYSKETWFLFCHEDFELREDIFPLLKCADVCTLHGVVGATRCGFAGFGIQVIYGNMTEQRRDGKGDEWRVGRCVTLPTECDTFDCCCLIVHSSLIAKYNLSFDENLEFDLYVEDFCASAKINHGIKSFVHPVNCCHHSGSRATERLYRHLPYLKEKYKHNYFTGTCTYFGTPTWQKRVQDFILGNHKTIVKNLFI